MSTRNSPAKYTEEFKKTIVSLYQSGKTYSQIQIRPLQLGAEIFPGEGG